MPDLENQKPGSSLATSVVIPFFNNRQTLESTVRSILACEPAPDEIILVDDGSNDGSEKIAKDLPVRLVKRNHQGRAAALNAGIECAQGDLILFTDADCIVPADWVAKLVEVMDDRQWAGVGGNLLPGKITAVETAKILPYIHEFEQGRQLEGAYTRYCLNGNNMALLAQALRAVGGFDERYLHGADADLTRRMLEAGYRLFRTTRITTTHLKVDSISAFLRTCFRRGSTVLFGMDRESFGIGPATRALILSPVRNFLVDLGNIHRLRVIDPDRSWWVKGAAGALINMAGALFNALGRIYYARRFAKEGR